MCKCVPSNDVLCASLKKVLNSNTCIILKSHRSFLHRHRRLLFFQLLLLLLNAKMYSVYCGLLQMIINSYRRIVNKANRKRSARTINWNFNLEQPTMKSVCGCFEQNKNRTSSSGFIFFHTVVCMLVVTAGFFSQSKL